MASASTVTSEIGPVDFEPGLLVRFYEAEIPTFSGVWEDEEYFRDRDYAKDGKFLGQVTGVTSPTVKYHRYYNDFIHGFYIDPDEIKQVVVEIRGYFKARDNQGLGMKCISPFLSLCGKKLERDTSCFTRVHPDVALYNTTADTMCDFDQSYQPSFIYQYIDNDADEGTMWFPYVPFQKDKWFPFTVSILVGGDAVDATFQLLDPVLGFYLPPLEELMYSPNEDYDFFDSIRASPADEKCPRFDNDTPVPSPVQPPYSTIPFACPVSSSTIESTSMSSVVTSEPSISITSSDVVIETSSDISTTPTTSEYSTEPTSSEQIVETSTVEPPIETTSSVTVIESTSSDPVVVETSSTSAIDSISSELPWESTSSHPVVEPTPSVPVSEQSSSQPTGTSSSDEFSQIESSSDVVIVTTTLEETVTATDPDTSDIYTSFTSTTQLSSINDITTETETPDTSTEQWGTSIDTAETDSPITSEYTEETSVMETTPVTTTEILTTVTEITTAPHETFEETSSVATISTGDHIETDNTVYVTTTTVLTEPVGGITETSDTNDNGHFTDIQTPTAVEGGDTSSHIEDGENHQTHPVTVTAEATADTKPEVTPPSVLHTTTVLIPGKDSAADISSDLNTQSFSRPIVTEADTSTSVSILIYSTVTTGSSSIPRSIDGFEGQATSTSAWVSLLGFIFAITVLY